LRQHTAVAAARLIYGARRRHHVKPLLRRLLWLSVPERVEFNTLFTRGSKHEANVLNMHVHDVCF